MRQVPFEYIALYLLSVKLPHINRLKDAILCFDAETALETDKSCKTLHTSTYIYQCMWIHFFVCVW